MLAYFKRVQPPKGKLFPGGLAWVDRDGIARVSTNREQPVRHRRRVRSLVLPAADQDGRAVRERRADVAHHEPAGRRHGRPDAKCRGEDHRRARRLAADQARRSPSQASLDLGFAGLVIIDRKRSVGARGLRHPQALRGGQAVRQRPVGRVVRHEGPRRRERPRPRLRPRQGAGLDGHPRSPALGGLRRRAPEPGASEILLLGGVALLGLILLPGSSRARVRRPARSASARRSGDSATRRSTRSRRRCSAACSPTSRRSRRSSPPPATSRAAPVSRSAGTGSTCCGAPTGSCTSRSGDVAGPRRRRGRADGTVAQRLPRLRPRARLAGGDDVAPDRHIGPDEMATAVVITIDP